MVRPGKKSLHLDGTIAIPGGHIEDGETEEQAARREFTEETGLVAGKLSEFPNNYVEDQIIRKDGPIEFSFKVFVTDECKGELLRNSDDEQPFWMDINEAKRTKLWANNNYLLEQALNYLGAK